MLPEKYWLHIRDARIAAGLTQHGVARQLDISDTTYQRYEYGTRAPDIVTLDKLADLFGVTLDYLVGRSDDPTRH